MPTATLAAAALASGLGWIVERQPPTVAAVLARRSRRVLFAVPTTRRQVAVTYDDGPTPELTPQLLDVLDRFDARATFFCLGSRAEQRPDLVAAVVARGHEIGNHTWADRPSVLLSTEAFDRDVQRTHAVLVAAGGRPVFLRPGSGWLRPAMLRAVERRGYRVALGSIAVRDLRVGDVRAEVAYVLARVRPGSVIVLHEGYADRAGVVPLTERLLSGLRSRGYAAVPLRTLAEAGSPGPRSTAPA